jgi:hypothetical protein
MAGMGFFTNEYMMAIHILQIIFIHIVMGLSGARIFLKSGGPTTRAYTIGLSMVGITTFFSYIPC